MQVLQSSEVVQAVLARKWASVFVVADDGAQDVELAKSLRQQGVVVQLVAPGCLHVEDQADGYIYGMDCQDAKFKDLAPGEFVISVQQLPAEVFPLG